MEKSNSKRWLTASFLSRHLIASAVSIILLVVAVIVAYFILLLIAIITNSGLGGPLALPFGIVFAFVFSLLYTALLLFPATSLAEVATKSLNNWKHIIQIPLSFLILTVLVGIVSAIAHQLISGGVDLTQWAKTSGILMLILAIPLGVYYWTMKFSHLIIEGLRKAAGWVWFKIKSK